MPKKSVVASLVGNFSPVYRSRAILVRRMRHFRGWIGELLKSRAIVLLYAHQSLPIHPSIHPHIPNPLPWEKGGEAHLPGKPGSGQS